MEHNDNGLPGAILASQFARGEIREVSGERALWAAVLLDAMWVMRMARKLHRRFRRIPADQVVRESDY